ncbi:MAG: 6-phospho-beta-glucosidase [Chloroflexi bacterium]|nr:6-phospho-beta-glucosidase [Chloroflexota bacterium]
MKLALIGGGGVRAPEFVRGALAFAADLDLQELWLMDIQAERLNLMAPLCQAIAGEHFKIIATQNLDEALRDAAMIVTTIRAGFEQGRVLDERIALNHNVIGQETTGPGGFAMAMRSVPALIDVAERAEVLAPTAWTFNFTNPAGLVAQTLHMAGYRRIVGICDSANTAQHEIAAWLKLDGDAVKTEVFGLNHLSWARQARAHGRNVLPEVLADDAFIQATHLRFFGGPLVRRLGMFLNEYLFYYYLRDVALLRLQDEEVTRGEEVQMLNQQLFEALRGLSPQAAFATYDAYNQRRSASYMAAAEADEKLREARSNPTQGAAPVHQQQAVGGYAGVALRTGLALTQNRPLRIGLNVPNGTSINGMRPDDVVEVTCEVDGSGIHPIHIGDIPEAQYLLMRAVKHYERLAAEAMLKRDKITAIEAMAAHPLVGSYPLAETLVTEYLAAHKLESWH